VHRPVTVFAAGLAGYATLCRRCGLQAQDVNCLATPGAAPVAAVCNPQQGGVDRANFLDMAIDVCQRGVNQ